MGTGVFTAPIDGTYMFSVHAQRVSSEISGIIKCGKQDNLDMYPYPARLPLAIPDIQTVLFAKTTFQMKKTTVKMIDDFFYLFCSYQLLKTILMVQYVC